MWKLVGIAAALALIVVIVRLAARPSPAARLEPQATRIEHRDESTELAGEPGRPLELPVVDGRAPLGTASSVSVPDPSSLVIRVLDGATPAAGAEVFLLDWGSANSDALKAFRAGFDPGWEREAEAFGALASADARGEARLAKPRSSARVVARRGDGFATLDLLEAEPGPVELVLTADLPVHVRVVDGEGLPAPCVPVSLRSAKRGGDVVLATTNDSGLAELRACEHRPTLVNEGATVALAIPLRKPVEVPVDLEAPPAEPIELVLPPLGSVEVELVDANGGPWLEPEHVLVEVSPGMLVELGERAECWQWRRSTGGRALFERVGLGLELRFFVEPDEHQQVRVKARGPEEPGQRVDVRLAIGGRFRVLTGRVVDEEGSPFRSVGLYVQLRKGRGGSGGPAHSDDDGRFRRTLEYVDESPDPVAIDISIREPRGMEHFAHLEGVQLSSGDADLGDVVLARTPLVASGTVLDERGVPVRGAKVVFYSDATEGVRYSGSQLEDAYCDALGHFELRRAIAEPLVGIATEAEDCVYGGPWIVPTGSSEVELVVQRGGWIGGSIRNEGGLWPSLSLRQGGKDVKPGSFRHAFPSDFRIGPVAPGTYSLAFGFGWMDEWPMVDGLEIVAGEETRDPRLDPLDLAILPKLVLTVVDEKGAALSALSVKVWRSKWGDFADCYPRRDGERWTFVAGKLPLRMRLSADGFRTLELDSVDSDRRVVMQHGIPVHIELTGALPEPPAGWSLQGALRTAGGSWGNRSAVFEWTAGSADLHLTEGGTYTLTFELFRRYPDGREQHENGFWNEEGNTLDVVDGAGPQVFRAVAPSPDVVREMSAYIDESE